MERQPDIVALVPARSGSKRIPGKNIRPLAGHPLLAYTVGAALQSGIFTRVVVSTDCPRTSAAAVHYGAEAPFLRPADMAGDLSPDIAWVRHALRHLADAGQGCDCFSILRPTSPFRLPATIHRAWKAFLADPGADSLRAVEKCSQHPGKMWVARGGRLHPLLPFGPPDQPWHSSPYQALPEVLVQNASLEIAWTRVALQSGTIAGEAVLPFYTQGMEGFDLNSPDDWALAEDLLRQGRAELPLISKAPWTGAAQETAR